VSPDIANVSLKEKSPSVEKHYPRTTALPRPGQRTPGQNQERRSPGGEELDSYTLR
jgi:hypothetical protein